MQKKTHVNQRTRFLLKAVKITEKIITNDWGLVKSVEINMLNMYVPNTGALKYVKQLLMYLKGEIT